MVPVDGGEKERFLVFGMARVCMIPGQPGK